MLTCSRCYWFKLKWRTGDGYCWHRHEPMHADESACPTFEAKVIRP